MSNYASDTPPEGSKDWTKTLGNLLLRGAEIWPDADALILPDQRLSYSALERRAMIRARALIALGVKPGDHIGILLPTSVEFAETLFAIAFAGAVVVPINARYRATELAYLTENADLVGIITSDRFTHADFPKRLCEALPSLAGAPNPHALSLPEAPALRWVAVLGTAAPAGFVPEAELADLARSIPEETPRQRALETEAKDTAIILYTSGTTSNPKGCLIGHGAQVGNSSALAGRYALTAQDRFWSPLPMFHIAAILPLVAVFTVGGAYLTMEYFEAGSALDMMEKERVTAAYPSFATFMLDLIHHPSFPARDLSKLRLMNSNLVMAPEAVTEAIRTALPHTIQVGTYGMTESAGTVSTSKLDDPLEQRLKRLGKPLDGWEIRIVDPETGRDQPRGHQGEIVARGPGVLKGYYKDPVKTAATIDADGWLHTGDVGSMDEAGTMMFHGRLKDMLKVGGENVAAAEIETFLARHPDIKLAQIVGIPDTRLVEVPAAFVELREGAVLEEAAVIAFCDGQIAKFKMPRHVRFVTEWPMGASKIQKYKLRDRLIAELNLA